MEILRKAHLAAGKDLPDPSTLRELQDTWLELIEPVPTVRLNDCYVYALQNRSEFDHGMLKPEELVRAWRQIRAAGEVTRVDPDPLVGDRMPPEELAANIRALLEESGYRDGGFRRAGEIAKPAPVRCIACSCDYLAADNPKGCPVCRVRALALVADQATAPDEPSLDDAMEAAPITQEDDDDTDLPF